MLKISGTVRGGQGVTKEVWWLNTDNWTYRCSGKMRIQREARRMEAHTIRSRAVLKISGNERGGQGVTQELWFLSMDNWTYGNSVFFCFLFFFALETVRW